MPNKPTLVFHYTDAITLKTTTKTFEEAIVFVMKVPRFASHPPLKIVIESTGKILYFDKPKFQAFVDGDIEAPELIDQTECDGLFRNPDEIKLTSNDIIDIGHLWKLDGQTFTLIDDDRLVQLDYRDCNFTEI